MNSTIRNTSIEVVQGDITNQPDIQVIVNAANAELRTGGGVAGAIHRAAGPSLEKECRQYAPIKPGEAVITSGYNLPNSHVIHCLGPRYGIDEPSDQLLARCYPRALGLAKEHGLVSIAFPAISTGAFGYPLREAARIAVQTVIDWVSEDQAISAFDSFSSTAMHSRSMRKSSETSPPPSSCQRGPIRSVDRILPLVD